MTEKNVQLPFTAIYRINTYLKDSSLEPVVLTLFFLSSTTGCSLKFFCNFFISSNHYTDIYTLCNAKFHLSVLNHFPKRFKSYNFFQDYKIAGFFPPQSLLIYISINKRSAVESYPSLKYELLNYF